MTTDTDVRDLTILGAGPTGLFAAFYAGMRGATARLVDSLDQVGGQVTALYPEKDIFDVGGFPKILGKDLVRQLKQQGLQWGAPLHLAETVTGLRREEVEPGRQGFVIVTERSEYKSRALIIAAGLGAFSPRKLPLPGIEQWEGKGVFDRVLDPQQFRGQRVVIVGGGDSAFDWCVNLIDIATSLTLVHRRDGFRAHQATVDQVMGYVTAGRMKIRTFSEVKAIQGTGNVESATIANSKTKSEEQVAVDVIIPQLGFHTALGVIEEWGLDIEKGEIRVSSTMATNIPGIF